MVENHPSPTNLSDNPVRPRAQAFDKRLGAAIRQRRILLGLSQQQMAERIGVTYQQAHKYEKGINRVSAGRLLEIAAALDTTVAALLADLDQPKRSLGPSDHRQIEVARNFARLSERHAAAVAALVRALVDEPEGDR
jgi:transcriptional regulator with XRE-family HTH domain